jgi:hypothetical protein
MMGFSPGKFGLLHRQENQPVNRERRTACSAESNGALQRPLRGDVSSTTPPPSAALLGAFREKEKTTAGAHVGKFKTSRPISDAPQRASLMATLIDLAQLLVGILTLVISWRKDRRR